MLYIAFIVCYKGYLLVLIMECMFMVSHTHQFVYISNHHLQFGRKYSQITAL